MLPLKRCAFTRKQLYENRGCNYCLNTFLSLAKRHSGSPSRHSFDCITFTQIFITSIEPKRSKNYSKESSFFFKTSTTELVAIRDLASCMHRRLSYLLANQYSAVLPALLVVYTDRLSLP